MSMNLCKRTCLLRQELFFYTAYLIKRKKKDWVRNGVIKHTRGKCLETELGVVDAIDYLERQ
jgi:hypothetical protein